VIDGDMFIIEHMFLFIADRDGVDAKKIKKVFDF